MDFANIRSIVVPEGDVSIVERAGEVLWRKVRYKRELAYLESTGTQWIDTDYAMTSDDLSFEGQMMWTKQNGSANFFFGYRSVQSAALTGDMRAFFVYGAAPVGRLAIRYGKSGDNSTAVTRQNTRHKISFDGSVLKVDDATFATLSGAYSPAQYKSMWLFSCNATGYHSADISPFVGRVYSFKMWQGDVLVRDLIPVLDLDDRPCMYDKVSGRLFYNVGTGEFAYGEIPRLPEEYQEVEYLEGTGSQYIDIGHASGANAKYEIMASILETKTSSEYKGLFGTSIAPDARCGSGFYGGKIRVQFGSGSAVYDRNYHDCSYTGYADKTTYELSKDGFYINGALEWKPQATMDASTGVSAWLFNTHAESLYSGTLLRVHSFKFWNNGDPVRDLVPCYRKSDGEPGMYDLVNATFFANAGSGEFILGPEI